ncbi:MAG TPA: LysM peptidoglycan-binding domain-containing protein [Ilumatobacter sp.]|nr:LysM peptidoglycan-binding domain-containing protein [Ilumatobacter sp.]
MNRSARSAFALVLGVVPFLVLAGCGTAEEGTANAALTPIQNTSYVTIEPATTTSTLPASATTQPGAGSISADQQSYTVVAGDTMYGIASKHGITLDQLVEYNQITVEPSQFLIIPGVTVLAIPPGSKVPGTEIAASTDPAVDPATLEGSVDPATATTLGVGCTYVIVAGDNPSKVSSKFGINIDALQGANADSNVVQTFIVGETLKIPAGADCSAAG